MSDTPTLCGEAAYNPLYTVCALPAVGPHPAEGFIRPLCYRHLARATQEHHEAMDALMAEMEMGAEGL